MDGSSWPFGQLHALHGSLASGSWPFGQLHALHGSLASGSCCSHAFFKGTQA